LAGMGGGKSGNEIVIEAQYETVVSCLGFLAGWRYKIKDPNACKIVNDSTSFRRSRRCLHRIRYGNEWSSSRTPVRDSNKDTHIYPRTMTGILFPHTGGISMQSFPISISKMYLGGCLLHTVPSDLSSRITLFPAFTRQLRSMLRSR